MNARESCALDVAERGPISAQKIARIMNMTREAVRLVIRKALSQLGKTAPHLPIGGDRNDS